MIQNAKGRKGMKKH